MDQPKSPEELEALKAKRRQERWSAFLTPFITLASIVISISLLMFFIKTCSERHPQRPGIPRTPMQPAER
ncbi:MAG: hypothetical protein A3F90_08390 [Deltaproteobacteria bacterium RIFCSPLOWO2_12_FULL_60_19]|nr:MAG: hypothetical protein A3F90_08390 [Deltaproteobacteria bacterium RIFCSPLOWO2_12_FULL_60_19]